jgi:hypothetical protein
MFEAISRGEFEGYTSGYVSLELKKAPEPKRSGNINNLKGYKGVVISTPLEFMDNEKNS